MSLYSADLLDVAAKPVKVTKKRKAGKVEEKVEEKVEAPQEEKVVKKPRTEKQLAALEKMKLARQKKKDDAEMKKKQQEELEKKKQAEILKKQQQVEARLEKRRQQAKARREKKKGETPAPAPATPPPSEPSEKQDPPAWFSKFVETVKQQEQKVSAEKKTQKVVREEAKEIAQDKWNDGLTRDRVQQEVDSHMGRMYSMMFGRR